MAFFIYVFHLTYLSPIWGFLPRLYPLLFRIMPSKTPLFLKKRCTISTSLLCFYEWNYHFFFSTMGLQEENGEKGQSVPLLLWLLKHQSNKGKSKVKGCLLVPIQADQVKVQFVQQLFKVIMALDKWYLWLVLRVPAVPASLPGLARLAHTGLEGLVTRKL